MAKIKSFKFDAVSGEFQQVEDKIKVPNFSEGEATTLYRKFLIEKGYEQHLGTTKIDKRKHGVLNYLTLFDKPLRCKFCLWHAKKDNATGKAVFWIGERNTKGFEQVDYGVVIEDRIIPTDVFWYALIVTVRSFRVGNNLNEVPFVDYLLVPVSFVIDTLKETKQGWIDLRKYHREQFLFDNMIDTFKDFDEMEYLLSRG
jgi:hypothetical protein